MQEEVDVCSAWRVVQSMHKRMPEARQLRTRWLLLLAHGCSVDEEELERLEAIVRLLAGALQVRLPDCCCCCCGRARQAAFTSDTNASRPPGGTRSAEQRHINA